jgi:hypothetical protein
MVTIAHFLAISFGVILSDHQFLYVIRANQSWLDRLRHRILLDCTRCNPDWPFVAYTHSTAVGKVAEDARRSRLQTCFSTYWDNKTFKERERTGTIYSPGKHRVLKHVVYYFSCQFIFCSPQCTSKWPNSKPHWATRQRAIAKTPAKWSTYQIPSVIVVFVVLIFKV